MAPLTPPTRPANPLLIDRGWGGEAREGPARTLDEGGVDAWSPSDPPPSQSIVLHSMMMGFGVCGHEGLRGPREATLRLPCAYSTGCVRPWAPPCWPWSFAGGPT